VVRAGAAADEEGLAVLEVVLEVVLELVPALHATSAAPSEVTHRTPAKDRLVSFIRCP
jgi:hypothetical protein